MPSDVLGIHSSSLTASTLSAAAETEVLPWSVQLPPLQDLQSYFLDFWDIGLFYHYIYLSSSLTFYERTFALLSLERTAVIFKISNTSLLEFYLQFQKIFATDSNGNLTLCLWYVMLFCCQKCTWGIFKTLLNIIPVLMAEHTA